MALAVLFVCVCATDLYIAKKPLDALVDSAASRSRPRERASGHEGVTEQAEALMAALPGDATLVSASAPDGVSAQVTLTASWHPPLVSPFVPDGIPLRATATSRTVLE